MADRSTTIYVTQTFAVTFSKEGAVRAVGHDFCGARVWVRGLGTVEDNVEDLIDFVVDEARQKHAEREHYALHYA